MERFQGGLVIKAPRLLYHSTQGSRVIKKKKLTAPEERTKMRGIAAVESAYTAGRSKVQFSI